MRLTTRGYRQASPGSRLWGRMRWWSISHWLIAINVAVFIVDLATGGLLYRWGAFSAAEAIHRLQLWRFVTSVFLHADVFHLLFNMLALYWFGAIVEQRLRRYRYIAFYLLCGIAGAMCYLVLWRMQFLIAHAETRLIGASGAIFGLLVATAVIAPNQRVRLLFPPIPLRMRTLALAYVGFAVLMIVTSGPNAGGEAAHLGGAAAGFVLIRNAHWLARMDPAPRRQRWWRPGDPAQNCFRKDVD